LKDDDDDASYDLHIQSLWPPLQSTMKDQKATKQVLTHFLLIQREPSYYCHSMQTNMTVHLNLHVGEVNMLQLVTS